MKNLKIVIPVVIVALIVVWLLWFRGPSVQSACENIVRITNEELEELGMEGMEMTVEECVEGYEESVELDPDNAPSAADLKCAAKAETSEDLLKCETE